MTTHDEELMHVSLLAMQPKQEQPGFAADALGRVVEEVSGRVLVLTGVVVFIGVALGVIR